MPAEPTPSVNDVRQWIVDYLDPGNALAARLDSLALRDDLPADEGVAAHGFLVRVAVETLIVAAERALVLERHGSLIDARALLLNVLNTTPIDLASGGAR